MNAIEKILEFNGALNRWTDNRNSNIGEKVQRKFLELISDKYARYFLDNNCFQRSEPILTIGNKFPGVTEFNLIKEVLESVFETSNPDIYFIFKESELLGEGVYYIKDGLLKYWKLQFDGSSNIYLTFDSDDVFVRLDKMSKYDDERFIKKALPFIEYTLPFLGSGHYDKVRPKLIERLEKLRESTLASTVLDGLKNV